MTPNVLTIAGSDPSGGAGIQADIKSISANGAYAMAVITGLTAQNTQGVSGVELVNTDFIQAQIHSIETDITIHAIKIGMLGNAAIIEAVANALTNIEAPLVLDPVMVAKSGDRLLALEAVNALRETLIPKAYLITPNLPEAADLLNTHEAKNLDEMRVQAHALLTLGCQAVMLKGGHLSEGDATDLLLTKHGETILASPRIATKNTHGTGCTLSSAIAAQIGLGCSLDTAVRNAKSYVSNAIAASDQLTVGQGHGPLHHFFDLAAWPDRLTGVK